MSSYEDYGKASGSYDDTRVAVGTEILLGAFAAGPVPLSQIELLDAGCGTGTYAEAVAPKVGSVTLLDASEDMLAVARQKLGSAPRFDYRVGRLQDLPYADASFDAVMTRRAQAGPSTRVCSPSTPACCVPAVSSSSTRVRSAS